MIINCINCNKRFQIDSSLIPNEGRLLQCGSCSHEWFFKKNINIEQKIIKKDLDLSIFNNDEQQEKVKNLDLTKKKKTENKHENEEIIVNKNEEKIANKQKIKKISFFNFLIVFLITFAAIVILVDTFKYSLNKIIPNIEFILYNLYESMRDIILFFNDLI